jgi:2-octaprenyl-6-methoxyphenol hydroxylase
MSAPRDADVLIVGGGLVGSVLANALTQIPLRVALIEARDPRLLEPPSFDGRATALANGSKRILEGLRLWPGIRSLAQPISTIHIGERGRFGAARIVAKDEGVDALGYTVENRVLGEAFWRALEDVEGFQALAPARLVALDAAADGVSATVERDGATFTIGARLLVAADGARSFVRRLLDVPARCDDYGQKAIIVNCATEVPHAGRAFERFTPDGPLAVLPLTQGRVAVVWTLAEAEADRVLELSDAAFRTELERAFGPRLGRIVRVGERAAHTLGRVRSDEVTRARAVFIGDAAVRLHPVAGQGFNLALRDVATLAEVAADATFGAQSAGDVGAPEVLERYGRWRRRDQRAVAWFTHSLVRGFGLGWPGLGTLRGLGLVAFDLAPGAKSLLARHTMGMAGRLPRLARRLGLTE